jgi:hypothetical protein
MVAGKHRFETATFFRKTAECDEAQANGERAVIDNARREHFEKLVRNLDSCSASSWSYLTSIAKTPRRPPITPVIEHATSAKAKAEMFADH